MSMRSRSRLVLLAALAAGVRGDDESVVIHGQTVRPSDHLLASAGELTLLVTTTSAGGASAARGAGREIAATSNDSIHIVNVGQDQADAVMTRLEGTAGVASVEFDQPVGLLPGEGEDDLRVRRRRLEEVEPYGISMVLENVPWWEGLFATSPPAGSAKICVVDTGYQNGHEDLPPLQNDADGFNPYGQGEWYIDGNSHGSHCAGTIGALGGNDKGVVGVIPGSLDNKFSFFIGKGLMDNGSGTWAGVIAAMDACVNSESNVISMSLGGSSPPQALQEAVTRYYHENDVLIIAAAGNGGNSAAMYPASYPAALSVAAVDSNENRAVFSQRNAQVEIAAPGVGVLSTKNSGYASLSGTSMAAPHVAGVAGLLRMYFPNCKAFQIRRAMIASAKDKGDAGCETHYGHGLIQAKQAFHFLEEHACDPNEAFPDAQGGCAEPVAAPVPPPTSPPVVPPTSPPVAPPTSPPAPGPTPSPVTGDDPVPGVIEVDLYKIHFTFTPMEACVHSDLGASPGGASDQQCAQACASLETCVGFVKPEDEDCVLYSGATDDSSCDDPVLFYKRSGVMHFN